MKIHLHLPTFVTLLSLPVQGALIAYEGFDYTTADYTEGLETLNGGSGWNGGWKEFGSSNAGNGVFAGDLAVTTDIAPSGSGNHANVQSATVGVGIGRNLPATVGDDGTTVWISYRFQNNDIGAGEQFAVFMTTVAESHSTLVGATRSVGGQSINDGQFDLAHIGGTNADIAARDTANHFVVLRFDFGIGNSDTVTAFWDPAGATDFNGSGNARISGINATFDGIAFTPGGATVQLDEIRIGTLLGDVTTIPEPSVGLLGAVAAFGLLRRRARAH